MRAGPRRWARASAPPRPPARTRKRSRSCSTSARGRSAASARRRDTQDLAPHQRPRAVPHPASRRRGGADRAGARGARARGPRPAQAFQGERRGRSVMTEPTAVHIRRVLFASDFSPHSDHAFEAALALARHFGARLHLIHVIHHSHGEEAARTQLEAFARERATGVEWSVAIGKGHAGAEIVKHAEEHKVELIVMGTHGRTGVAHAVRGSVAEVVMRHAPCLVLTIRMKAELPLEAVTAPAPAAATPSAARGPRRSLSDLRSAVGRPGLRGLQGPSPGRGRLSPEPGGEGPGAEGPEEHPRVVVRGAPSVRPGGWTRGAVPAAGAVRRATALRRVAPAPLAARGRRLARDGSRRSRGASSRRRSGARPPSSRLR